MSFTKKDKQMYKLMVDSGHKKIIDIHASCHKGFSRRDILSSGLATMTAGFLPVPLMQLITQKAHASDALDCPKESGDFPIFVNIQLNGGPALFAQHLASGSKGAPLDSYAKMALPPSPRRVAYFANKAPFWIDDNAQPQSGMMRGLFRHLPRPVLTGLTADPITGAQQPTAFVDNIHKNLHDHTSFVAVACESIDDSFNNPIDLSGVLAAAGIVGNSLPHLLTGVGSFQSESINEIPIVQGAGCILAPAPMTIVHTKAPALAEDFLRNSITLTGALQGVPEPAALMSAINELSDIQLRALANSPHSTESRAHFRRLLRCATTQNETTIASGGAYNIYDNTHPKNAVDTGVDRTSVALKTIWKKNRTDAEATSRMMALGLNGANMNIQLARIGTIVSACASGLGQACTINLGGYDYHEGFYDRASANVKDEFYGDIIGRCLRTAATYNRKMFIYVSADGSVANAGLTPDSPWTGEFFKRGMHYIFAYTPGAAPATAGLAIGENNEDASFQLNQFSESQNVVKTTNQVATANPIGAVSAQDLCGAAVFLNYLNHAGRPDILDKPALAKIKKKLVDSTPSEFSIDQYFARIKSS